MLNKVFIHFFIALVLAMNTPVFANEDASMQQIYDVAKSGRLTEALTMMDSVLADHPNSAKAHYVEAELLAKKGELSAARTELEKAEQLKPGLPFVHPESLAQLKAALNMTNAHAFSPASPAGMPFGLSWSSILLLAFIMIGVAFILRKLTASNVNQNIGNSTFGGRPSTMPNNTYRAMSNNQPMPQPSGYQPMAAQPSMGSGIMSGLATGAAVGAGIVAGEVLAHHFLDGDHAATTGMTNPFISDTSTETDSGQFDMGGTDFGISDNDVAFWDDANDNSDDDSWS